jgi:hypothetical protein
MSSCTTVIKGTVSQIIILKVLKIKSELSVYVPMVFQFFASLLLRKILFKGPACFYENTY